VISFPKLAEPKCPKKQIFFPFPSALFRFVSIFIGPGPLPRAGTLRAWGYIRQNIAFALLDGSNNSNSQFTALDSPSGIFETNCQRFNRLFIQEKVFTWSGKRLAEQPCEANRVFADKLAAVCEIPSGQGGRIAS
jgi:hypothetical protein